MKLINQNRVLKYLFKRFNQENTMHCYYKTFLRIFCSTKSSKNPAVSSILENPSVVSFRLCLGINMYMVNIPIVGTITAGAPILAQEHI